eukprot:scaffold93810_cov34-Attheya_sp.AAC.1
MRFKTARASRHQAAASQGSGESRQGRRSNNSVLSPRSFDAAVESWKHSFSVVEAEHDSRLVIISDLSQRFFDALGRGESRQRRVKAV